MHLSLALEEISSHRGRRCILHTHFDMYAPETVGWQQGGPPPDWPGYQSSNSKCWHQWQVRDQNCRWTLTASDQNCRDAWWNNHGCWMMYPSTHSDVPQPPVLQSPRLIQFLQNHDVVEIVCILKSRNIWSFADVMDIDRSMKADIYLAAKEIYSPKILGQYAWSSRRQHNMGLICHSGGIHPGHVSDDKQMMEIPNEVLEILVESLQIRKYSPFRFVNKASNDRFLHVECESLYAKVYMRLSEHVRVRLR